MPAPRGAESIGPYEQITGKIHGELDPNDPKNAIITDIKLAPRNARGKVEYVATFTFVRPVDMTKSSGVLRYSVVNRGGGQAVASPDGHVTLVSGWQGDVAPTANNQTITVPVARKANGTSITGPLLLALHQSIRESGRQYDSADDSTRAAALRPGDCSIRNRRR